MNKKNIIRQAMLVSALVCAAGAVHAQGVATHVPVQSGGLNANGSVVSPTLAPVNGVHMTAPTYANGNIRTASPSFPTSAGNPAPVAAGQDLQGFYPNAARTGGPANHLQTPASFRNQNLIVGNGTNPRSNFNGSTSGTSFGTAPSSFSNPSTVPVTTTAPLNPTAPQSDQQLQNSRSSFQTPR